MKNKVFTTKTKDIEPSDCAKELSDAVIRGEIFDPFGLFLIADDKERHPYAYSDLYKRDVLLYIPLNIEKNIDGIYQYIENGITLKLISEMAKKCVKIGGYFQIYPSRYFGPSDWYFEHLGDGKLRQCGDYFDEKLGHIVIMREIDPGKFPGKARRKFKMDRYTPIKSSDYGYLPEWLKNIPTNETKKKYTLYKITNNSGIFRYVVVPVWEIDNPWPVVAKDEVLDTIGTYTKSELKAQVFAYQSLIKGME